MTTESNKQKIAKIHDIFPLATKDQIAKVLQYYDDDESQALDAITRDGGREALSNWAESVNAKSKNNKNKKKKKKGKKEPGLVGSATASFDADDSSSLHSSGNVDTEIEREYPIAESRNGVLDSADDTKLVVPHDRLSVLETDVTCSSPVQNEASTQQVACISSIPDDSKCSIAESENPACASPVSSNSDKQDDLGSKKEKYRSVKDEGHGKYSSRQRTNSFRRSKTSSFSEDSATLHNPQISAAATKRGDDHSENSEGSASTSGCSSLVSSNNRLVESPFQNVRSDMKRKRREPDTSKSRFTDDVLPDVDAVDYVSSDPVDIGDVSPHADAVLLKRKKACMVFLKRDINQENRNDSLSDLEEEHMPVKKKDINQESNNDSLSDLEEEHMPVKKKSYKDISSDSDEIDSAFGKPITLKIQDHKPEFHIFEVTGHVKISEIYKSPFEEFEECKIVFMYDPLIGGYHIYIYDNETLISHHAISQNAFRTFHQTSKEGCRWRALDFGPLPIRRRWFHVSFVNADIRAGFRSKFIDGKYDAEISKIVEKGDCLYSELSKEDAT